MITDNIATLFDAGQPGVRFRQGTILTWDANSGANTIDLAGGTLTNVPILNTGEAVALKTGHIVGLLGQGSTWFIIGRVTLPSDPNFASASVAFGSGGAQLFNYSVSTTETLKASSSEIVVPDWADEAIVIVAGNGCVVNNQASVVSVAMEVGVNGGHGGGAWNAVQPGQIGSFAAASRNLFTGLSGGETLTLEALVVCNTLSIAANGANALFMHGIAVFKSNV
ncbi:hypothetical protein GCM10009804_03220 [Kribbella hippodromi]|uniref:Uncharacterized protein n=1 Tax=Kribbella hippodromi TaxID=434347 RepID=A0ABN2BZD6_9ACTN